MTDSVEVADWRTRHGIDGLATHRRGITGDNLDVLYSSQAVDPDIGLPGEFPYTRGVYPAMYRDRLWQMRLYSGFGDAESTNERSLWTHL